MSAVLTLATVWVPVQAPPWRRQTDPPFWAIQIAPVGGWTAMAIG